MAKDRIFTGKPVMKSDESPNGDSSSARLSAEPLHVRRGVPVWMMNVILRTDPLLRQIKASDAKYRLNGRPVKVRAYGHH